MISRFLVSEDSNSFQKRHILLLKIILTGLLIFFVGSRIYEHFLISFLDRK